jgi:hypothetical protein
MASLAAFKPVSKRLVPLEIGDGFGMPPRLSGSVCERVENECASKYQAERQSKIPGCSSFIHHSPTLPVCLVPGCNRDHTDAIFSGLALGLCICSLSEPSERPGRKVTQQRQATWVPKPFR